MLTEEPSIYDVTILRDVHKWYHNFEGWEAFGFSFSDVLSCGWEEFKKIETSKNFQGFRITISWNVYLNFKHFEILFQKCWGQVNHYQSFSQSEGTCDGLVVKLHSGFIFSNLPAFCMYPGDRTLWSDDFCNFNILQWLSIASTADTDKKNIEKLMATIWKEFFTRDRHWFHVLRLWPGVNLG